MHTWYPVVKPDWTRVCPEYTYQQAQVTSKNIRPIRPAKPADNWNATWDKIVSKPLENNIPPRMQLLDWGE